MVFISFTISLEIYHTNTFQNVAKQVPQIEAPNCIHASRNTQHFSVVFAGRNTQPFSVVYAGRNTQHFSVVYAGRNTQHFSANQISSFHASLSFSAFGWLWAEN